MFSTIGANIILLTTASRKSQGKITDPCLTHTIITNWDLSKEAIIDHCAVGKIVI